MTREERKKAIDSLKISAPIMAVTQEEFNDYIQTLNKVMDWLEQEPCDDCISRQATIKYLCTNMNWYDEDGGTADDEEKLNAITDLVNGVPSVTPQPKIGYCKDCKWWKDSDGVYRRDCYTESKCPMNRREVFEGNGYCYIFEPKMQEVEE